MPTWRGFSRRAFQCCSYEAQDVLVESDHVDLVSLEAGRGLRLREHWLRRLAHRDPTGRLMRVNPGLRTVNLRQSYDLFLVHCQINKELHYINALKGWERRCRASICVLDEIWTADILEQRRLFVSALKRFDHVVVGLEGSVDALSNLLGRQCHFVPPAVDTIRFSPYPNPPQRVIDVFSFGRHREPVHEALLRMAAGRELFYMHDTLADGGESRVRDHRQHRDLLASYAKRSIGLLVAQAKCDGPGETCGQIEVPNRYYEGAAAGAILVGQRPECGYFDRLFDWPEAVVEIKPDGSDTESVIAGLLDDPVRAKEIGRRNAEEALRCHDWVYRWKEILAIAKLEPTPRMRARELRINQLADLAQADAA